MIRRSIIKIPKNGNTRLLMAEGLSPQMEPSTIRQRSMAGAGFRGRVGDDNGSRLNHIHVKGRNHGGDRGNPRDKRNSGFHKHEVKGIGFSQKSRKQIAGQG